VIADVRRREKQSRQARYVGPSNIAKIKDTGLDFDVLIATPDKRASLATGRVSVPRGLMPTPKPAR